MCDQRRIPCHDVSVETRIEQLTKLNGEVRPQAMENIEEGQSSQKSYYDQRHENEVRRIYNVSIYV